MAKGNEIVLTPDPRGRRREGIIDGTPKPGTVMQVKAATAAVNGRFTYEAFSRDADGNRPQGAIWILDIDHLQGKINTDAYVAGTRGFLYCPLPGDELNVIVEDVSGTGDDIAIGDLFIVDSGTGKLILTTGTPESEPFVALEAVTDPTADTLLYCEYTGH